MSAVDLRVFADAETLAHASADFITARARDSIAQRGRFTLVLTGGSTPERMYRLLAEPAHAAAIDWSRTVVFVGDERFVPESDSRSNFGMARRALLDRVAVPASNLYPIPTDCTGPAAAAERYSAKLARFFNSEPDGALAPVFDLVLLGLGEDGHVASLFPGKPALHVTDRWVTWSPPGTLPPPVDRVTLTFPLINAARAVLFLVAGDKKAAAVCQVLGPSPDWQRFPGANVRPTSGALHWHVDKAAASMLPPASAQRPPDA